MIGKRVFIALCMLASSFAEVSAQTFKAPKEVSIVQLIANPTEFNGKEVRVFGFFHHRFEESALYLSETDAEFFNTRNAIWVGGTGSKITMLPARHGKIVPQLGKFVPRVSYFDCRFVTLEGTFKSGGSLGSGHSNQYPSEITNVKSISERVRVPSEPVSAEQKLK